MSPLLSRRHGHHPSKHEPPSTHMVPASSSNGSELGRTGSRKRHQSHLGYDVGITMFAEEPISQPIHRKRVHDTDLPNSGPWAHLSDMQMRAHCSNIDSDAACGSTFAINAESPAQNTTNVKHKVRKTPIYVCSHKSRRDSESCGRSFSSRSLLKKHEESAHKDERLLPAEPSQRMCGRRPRHTSEGRKSIGNRIHHCPSSITSRGQEHFESLSKGEDHAQSQLRRTSLIEETTQAVIAPHTRSTLDDGENVHVATALRSLLLTEHGRLRPDEKLKDINKEIAAHATSAQPSAQPSVSTTVYQIRRKPLPSESIKIPGDSVNRKKARTDTSPASQMEAVTSDDNVSWTYQPLSRSPSMASSINDTDFEDTTSIASDESPATTDDFLIRGFLGDVVIRSLISIFKVFKETEGALHDADVNHGSHSSGHGTSLGGHMPRSSLPSQIQIDDDSSGEHEDDTADEGNGSPGGRQVSKRQGSSGLKFACPFYKKYPNRAVYPRCAIWGGSEARRVKEHIYKDHCLPYCWRCKEIFGYTALLEAHCMLGEGCVAQELPDNFAVITTAQKSLLKNKRSQWPGEVGKWRHIYKILNPEVADDDIPSPYCNMTNEQGEHLQNFVHYAEPRLPPAILNAVASDRERVHQAFRDRRSIDDVQLHFESFERNLDLTILSATQSILSETLAEYLSARPAPVAATDAPEPVQPSIEGIASDMHLSPIPRRGGSSASSASSKLRARRKAQAKNELKRHRSISGVPDGRQSDVDAIMRQFMAEFASSSGSTSHSFPSARSSTEFSRPPVYQTVDDPSVVSGMDMPIYATSNMAAPALPPRPHTTDPVISHGTFGTAQYGDYTVAQDNHAAPAPRPYDNAPALSHFQPPCYGTQSDSQFFDQSGIDATNVDFTGNGLLDSIISGYSDPQTPMYSANSASLAETHVPGPPEIAVRAPTPAQRQPLRLAPPRPQPWNPYNMQSQ